MHLLGKIIGVLQIVVILLKYGIYTSQIFVLLKNSIYLTTTGVFLLVSSIAFFVLPFVGVWALFNLKRWGYICLAGFPVIAYIFGVTAIPFISFIYGTNAVLNSVMLMLINTGVAAVCIWLYWKESI